MLHFFICTFFVFSPGESDSTVFKMDSVRREVQSFSLVDTSRIVHKKFSTTEVEKLKSEDELNYNQPPTVAESWWTRFKNWVAYLISRLLRGATTTNIGRIILFVIGGVLLVAIIMMFMKVNAFRVFFSGADQGKSNYQIFEENIHELDFKKLIDEAVKSNDFRLATRLTFLYSLKILSDRQLIHWLPGKTNHDYVEELERNDLKEGFQELSIYFDYAWYGNFKVSHEIFQKMENAFHQWKEKVS